jgi:hypothetical protein
MLTMTRSSSTLRTALGAAAGMVAVVSLTGCAGAGDGGAGNDVPQPDLPALTRVTSATQAEASSFTEAFESTEELYRQRDAYERLMDRCTRRFGYPFVPSEHYQPREQYFDLAQPYGPVDLARVRKVGYHDPASMDAGIPPTPSWEGAATPSWVVTRRGAPISTPASAGPVPEGGCDREVVRSLGGPRPEQAVAIAGKAFVDADKDPRWRAAVRAWSACMAQRGYDYVSSVAAVHAFRDLPGRPSARELAVAEADVRCKDSTRQVDLVVAILAAHERSAMTSNADEFAAYARWRDANGAAVDRVLATEPAPLQRYWLDAGGRHLSDPPSATPKQ